MMCFAQNTKQILHFRHPSYPSISGLLENCRFGVLSLKRKKRGAGANACSEFYRQIPVNSAVVKRHHVPNHFKDYF